MGEIFSWTKKNTVFLSLILFDRKFLSNPIQINLSFQLKEAYMQYVCNKNSMNTAGVTNENRIGGCVGKGRGIEAD